VRGWRKRHILAVQRDAIRHEIVEIAREMEHEATVP